MGNYNLLIALQTSFLLVSYQTISLMNIGIVVDNEFNNDIRVFKEANILKTAGHTVFVLCYGYRNKENLDSKDFFIERILINPKLKDILFFLFNRIPLYEYLWKLKINRFINKNSIDVIHTHDLYMSKAAHLGIKSSNRNCPLILDLHENYPIAVQDYNWTKGLLRHLISAPQKWIKKEKEYLKYASKIIVLSNAFKTTLLERYSFLNSDNIIAFPNIIDFQRFKSFKIDNKVKKKKNITLFYFGAVAERRGIFDAIEALKNVLNKGYHIDLLIIGPIDKADKTKFYSLINEVEVKNHIDYISWIKLSELLSYLNVVDICLAPFIRNPQHESGVANKIYQYMYGGKPIIASDCLPQKELIESTNCGLIYSNQDEFIESIIYLIKHPNQRKEMGVNGYKELNKRYNNDNYKNILINIYDKIRNQA